MHRSPFPIPSDYAAARVRGEESEYNRDRVAPPPPPPPPRPPDRYRQRHPGTNAIFSDNLTGFKIAFHLYTPYQFHAVPIYAFDKVKSFIRRDSPGIGSGSPTMTFNRLHAVALKRLPIVLAHYSTVLEPCEVALNESAFTFIIFCFICVYYTVLLIFSKGAMKKTSPFIILFGRSSKVSTRLKINV